MTRFRFTRTQRITRRAEYQTIYSQGKSSGTPGLRIYAMIQPFDSPPQLGISISKQVGKANIRNRLKRCIREIFRLHQHEIKPGTQLVVVAKPECVMLTYPELEQRIMKLMEKLRVSKAREPEHG